MDNDKEVNLFEEVSYVEPSEETETVEIPEAAETAPEAVDTPASSSEAEKPAQEPEAPKAEEELRGRTLPEPEVKEPRPVDGETPRERALRLEAQRLKKALRDERTKALLTDPAQPTLSDDKQKILAQYDQTEVQNLEQLFDILAEKKGYVKKGELEQTTAQTTFSDFLEGHPEYSKENDPDDVLWNRFQQEWNSGIYDKKHLSQNPQALKKALNKIHSEVFGVQPTEALSKVDAQTEKIKVASHTSGATPSRAAQKATDPNLSQVARSGGMKGFSEAELAELGL